jgi:hypothetical protein
MKIEHSFIELDDHIFKDNRTIREMLFRFETDGWELVAVEPENLKRPTRLWFKRTWKDGDVV